MTVHVVVERHDSPPYVQFVGVYSERKYADRLLEQLLSEGRRVLSRELRVDTTAYDEPVGGAGIGHLNEMRLG